MEISDRDRRKIVRAVKRKWASCQDVRINSDNEWEVAVKNTLGGPHWVSERAVPAMANEVLQKVKKELEARCES